MVSLVPAFGGVPGGPELVIIMVIAVVLFGVPLVLVAAAVLYLATRSDDEATTAEAATAETADDDRIAELEAEVERLREQVGDEADGPEEEEEQRS
jgi:sec-independent protein translocase protein TatA